jgi:transcription-repair coupling factor (superfamily II helicase)
MTPIRIPDGTNGHFHSGIPDAGVAPMVVREALQGKNSVTVLLDNKLSDLEYSAREIEFYASQAGLSPDVHILPDAPEVDVEKDRFFDIHCDRISTLTHLLEYHDGKGKGGRPLLLLATPTALFQPCPTPEFLQAREIRLARGQEVPFDQLVRDLAEKLGYYNEPVCETPGEFSVRGGLVDVYPLNAPAPHRIDFFGDEIEQIRVFDPTTQRTLHNVDELTIAAAPEGDDLERARDCLDYLPPEILWIVHEPHRIEENHYKWLQHPDKIKNAHRDFRDIFDRPNLHNDRWVALAEFEGTSKLFTHIKGHTQHLIQPSGAFHISLASQMDDGGNLALDEFETLHQQRHNFLKELLYWKRERIHTIIVYRTTADERQTKEILAQYPDLSGLEPDFVQGNLHEGIRVRDRHFPEIFPRFREKAEHGIAFISTDDILGRQKTRLPGYHRRKLPQHTQVDHLLDFTELADGDPVVHLQHGIGLYRGIRHIRLGGEQEEVITLEFEGETFLHVPLRQSHLLTRYVGLAKTRPKLGKPGSTQWEKTRAKAEKAALDYAAELLSLQAKRQVEEGHSFGEDHPWQDEFEQAFPHRETADQQKAIDSVKTDMQETRPMDRLICGDVGFGKTEVAIRACFRAVMAGKQVAFLAPTTVLAQQHYRTLKDRFTGYPILIEQASRFVPTGRIKKNLQDLKQGKIDILVGTHRLLSKDVHFKDIGLLIVDEEQRFGVQHKERIKHLRANLDILTLSATPIPRTLYMALAGARDLSTIETPPRSRLPIQTFVKPYDKELVQKAILHETGRGGQVFYLHNKVQTISQVASRLQEMFPKLRIAVGHGQMPERELETIMTEFVEYRYDVLVCTTIIESGLDIPNCNTLIIEGADRFGLSQLYQIRGRVGRFNRQAYAYLLLHRDTHLRDQARKRLASIRHYNQLGAGFRIAMRDLELRGAGNLLGTQQSGHIAGVGFDLYCQLLRQSIASLKGEVEATRIRASVQLDFVHFGESDPAVAHHNATKATNFQQLKYAELEDTHVPPIEALIPESYIEDAHLRINFYRKLATCPDEATLQSVVEELVDRFKKYPKPVEALLLTTEIRIHAESRGILRVETVGNRLKLRLPKGNPQEYVQIGKRFPRLTTKQPLPRLREILRNVKKHKA